jgi:hypothetical protein
MHGSCGKIFTYSASSSLPQLTLSRPQRMVLFPIEDPRAPPSLLAKLAELVTQFWEHVQAPSFLEFLSNNYLSINLSRTRIDIVSL